MEFLQNLPLVPGCRKPAAAAVAAERPWHFWSTPVAGAVGVYADVEVEAAGTAGTAGSVAEAGVAVADADAVVDAAAVDAEIVAVDAAVDDDDAVDTVAAAASLAPEPYKPTTFAQSS